MGSQRHILEHNGIGGQELLRVYRGNIHAVHGDWPRPISQNRAASLATVDLPLPEGPISAVTSPCWAVKETSFSTVSPLL